MFDMAVECGAAINIKNKLGLTPLTTAAYLAKCDMFFHIASIEREVSVFAVILVKFNKY